MLHMQAVHLCNGEYVIIIVIIHIPELKIIPSSPSGNEELLSAISYCTFVFTFSDPSESPAQRDSKRLQLTRLVSILKSSKKPVHEKVLGASSGHDLSQPLQATPSTFQPFFFPHRIARRRRPHLYILIPMVTSPNSL